MSFEDLSEVGETELTLLINNTNSELKCALFGIMDNEQPRSPLDIQHELVDRGGSLLETTICSTTLKTLGRLSTKFVERTTDGLLLTDAGMLARSFAGHQMTEISPIAPLHRVYGHQRDTELETHTTYLKRILMLRTLALTKPERIPQSAVIKHLEYSHPTNPKREFTAANIRLMLKRLDSARLVLLDDSTGRREVIITPTARKVGLALGPFIKAAAGNTSAHFVDGHMNLNDLMKDRDRVGYAVRRSLMSSPIPRHELNTFGELIVQVVESIQTKSPVSSKDIYYALPEAERSKKSIKTFTSDLHRLRSQPGLPLNFEFSRSGKYRLLISKKQTSRAVDN
jgi:hypothetical protein